MSAVITWTAISATAMVIAGHGKLSLPPAVPAEGVQGLG
jgi:hypothetical protein